jgi:hypothetical protein
MKRRQAYTYTLWHELTASPTERRIRDIVNRKGQQHDVLIVGL